MRPAREVCVTSQPTVASSVHGNNCFSNEPNELNLAYISFKIDILYIYFFFEPCDFRFLRHFVKVW